MTGLGSRSICTLRKGSCDWQLWTQWQTAVSAVGGSELLFVTPEPSSLGNKFDLPFSFYSSHSCRRPWSVSSTTKEHLTPWKSQLTQYRTTLNFHLYWYSLKDPAPPTHLPQEHTLTGWALRNLVWTPGGLVCHNPKGATPTRTEGDLQPSRQPQSSSQCGGWHSKW